MHIDAAGRGAELKLFWWVFAVRGGMALLFACVLAMMASLFGLIFLDPVVLAFLTLVLGFYIVGSGIVLGVAAGFAAEHHLGLWKTLLADCLFAVAFGSYIAISLIMSPHVLGLLAGIHAVGIGVFQIAMAWRLRHDQPAFSLLSVASMLSLLSGYFFLTQLDQPIRITTSWLCYFEVLCGLVALAFAWRLHARTPSIDSVFVLVTPAAMLKGSQ